MTGTISKAGRVVDVAIITIRPDEERAVLRRLSGHRPDKRKNRIYAVGDIQTNSSPRGRRTIAVVRCPEEGQVEASGVARDVIEDLQPGAIVVVGIAGGFPDTEFSLGDVIVATRVQDLRITALLHGEPSERDIRGGPVSREVEVVVSALQRLGDLLGEWNSPGSIGMEQPSVSLKEENFFGSDDWKVRLRTALTERFGKGGRKRRRPNLVTAALASSDNLVKDVASMEKTRSLARKAAGCEMEMAGVFEAARRRQRAYPVYGIRGISDIVGFKRSGEWTRYACETAAAFAFALIRTGLVPDESEVIGGFPTSKASDRDRVEESMGASEINRRQSLVATYGSGEKRGFEPARGFIDRGDAHSAVALMLEERSFDQVEPSTQLAITAVWQKFGFVNEAERCLDSLHAPRNARRLDVQQHARYRVLELKLCSQLGRFAEVRDSHQSVLDALAAAELRIHVAAVYRRAAVAYAVLGQPADAGKCLQRANQLDSESQNDHAIITGRVFAAVVSALGDVNPPTEPPLDVLTAAPEVYLSSPMDRTVFQAHPLKSAVMCLFSEASLYLVDGNPKGWRFLTAAHLLAPLGSSHPRSEGYAELLGLLRSREDVWEAVRLAMYPEGQNRREFHSRYSQVSCHLVACQQIPELVLPRTPDSWARIREYLERLNRIL